MSVVDLKTPAERDFSKYSRLGTIARKIKNPTVRSGKSRLRITTIWAKVSDLSLNLRLRSATLRLLSADRRMIKTTFPSTTVMEQRQ